jgi:hypothetical protein
MVYLKFNLKVHKKSYDHFPETSEGGGFIRGIRVINYLW